MRKRITIEVCGERADEVIQAVADTTIRISGHSPMNTCFRMYQQILPENSFHGNEGMQMTDGGVDYDSPCD